MEAALRTVLVHMFEDYVKGLDKADLSSFPVALRDLQLQPKGVNEALEDTPFTLEQGSIGRISITPGWTGNVEVEATGIKLNLSFSAMKAAKLAMQPSDVYNTDEVFLTGAYSPNARPPPNPASIPPRFCPDHDSSDKRQKGEPRECACKSCGITFMSTYKQVELCSMCSDQQKRCLICGKSAPKAGDYVPTNVLGRGGAGGQAKEKVACERTSFRQGGPPAGSMRQTPGPHGQAGTSFKQDPYSNLQPTDSIPVMQGRGNGAQASASPTAPPPKAAAPATAPQGKRPPAQQQGMGSRRPVPPQQRRDEKEADDPISNFLRRLNCGVAALFDDEEEPEVRPVRRPPPGAPGGPGTARR